MIPSSRQTISPGAIHAEYTTQLSRAGKIDLVGHDSLEEEIRSFINAVVNRSRPLISGEDARKSLDLAIDIIKKMRVAEVI